MTPSTARATPRAVLSSLDPEALQQAVHGSTSWRQVLLTLQLRSHRHVPELRARCAQQGIDCGHLDRRAPPDAVVREALTTAASWPAAMAALGYAPQSGSARATLHRHAARLGVDVRHLTDGGPRPQGGLRLAPSLDHLRHAGAYLAAGAFALAGHRISWPLEPAAYDLLVDTGQTLLRVQVKTGTERLRGSWACSLRRSEYAGVVGGKRKVCYAVEQVDVFAVVDGDGRVYVIPYRDVAGRTHLVLRHFAAYRLPRLGQDGAADPRVGLTGFEPATP